MDIAVDDSGQLLVDLRQALFDLLVGEGDPVGTDNFRDLSLIIKVVVEIEANTRFKDDPFGLLNQFLPQLVDAHLLLLLLVGLFLKAKGNLLMERVEEIWVLF